MSVRMTWMEGGSIRPPQLRKSLTHLYSQQSHSNEGIWLQVVEENLQKEENKIMVLTYLTPHGNSILWSGNSLFFLSKKVTTNYNKYCYYKLIIVLLLASGKIASPVYEAHPDIFASHFSAHWSEKKMMKIYLQLRSTKDRQIHSPQVVKLSKKSGSTGIYHYSNQFYKILNLQIQDMTK